MGLFSKKKKVNLSATDSLNEMKKATARFEFSQQQKPKETTTTQSRKTYNYQSEKPSAYRTTQDRIWDFLFTDDK
tara:strand:- start:266 stop:490 length:225 start_codon:yes stop_codon:yes gene_type:complete